MNRILITGAFGQLGSEITDELRTKYGESNVVASDISKDHPKAKEGIFEYLDVTDAERLEEIVEKHGITQIYHLAALLSSVGESKPQMAWDINMNGLVNVLEIARKRNLDKVYWPSSIAVFGPDSPKQDTPQNTIMNPTTMYGISKLAGEKLCEYYHAKFGVDVRSIRYPGLIGWKALPGGGTTDYAVDIYHKAVNNEPFECFLAKGTALPMMYMDDAVRGTIELMEAPAEKIKVRTSYNFSAISFTPEEILASIQKIVPELEMTHNPDHRQGIAESWPQSIADDHARKDWGWTPEFDLDRMSEDIIKNLREIYYAQKEA
ncbi:L-threonine 3-dehydrogenase [Fulvitalea axinellae]|uniref:L-threonine 3-dehydrogenase n=1 Tax=Fulvitalea axinellae TaxID=1182444 RepID=A0AAU9C6M8_9BACT|nr:L-threonine 3-dehydrogenase [Fulvitalea axinellae]